MSLSLSPALALLAASSSKRWSATRRLSIARLAVPSPGWRRARLARGAARSREPRLRRAPRARRAGAGAELAPVALLPRRRRGCSARGRARLRRAGAARREPAGAEEPGQACPRRRRRARPRASTKDGGRLRSSSVAIRTFSTRPASRGRRSKACAENFSDGVVAPILWIAHRAGFRRRALEGDQHRRQHDRPPDDALPRLRLGRGAARRSRQPAGARASPAL